MFIAVKDWEGKFDPMDECEGAECDEDVEDRPSCDECADEDAMCMENCWSVEPSESYPPKDENKPRLHKPKKAVGNRLMGGLKTPRQGGKNRILHKTPKKMMRKMSKKMLWKPKGRKMHQMMGKMHMGLMGPMGPPRDPMRSPIMSSMGPMVHGVKSVFHGKMYPGTLMGPMIHRRKPVMAGMTHPEKFMGPMMHGKKPMMHGMKYGMDKMHRSHMMRQKMMGMGHGKPYIRQMTMEHPMMGHDTVMDETMRGHRIMHHRMETGPIMHSRRRGEFYTKVIFVRDGTCNAIVHDLSCFGEQKTIRMRAGRVGKTPISVPMCPRPTIMKKTTAQFTCDNGASFMKPVLLPVRCSYVPCNPGFWLPDWNQNRVEKTKSWPKGGL